MANHKDFKDRDIDYEINLKANTFNTVRTARVLASERLYNYAQKWEVIFLILNIIASGLLVFSIINDENTIRLTISAFFSLYSLLLQNFCAKLNYNERALRYHYHQLALEDLLLELKFIIFEKGMPEDEKVQRYKGIIEKYQISLEGYQNHSEIDHARAKGQAKRDFSWDNILIYSQFPIMILIILTYALN